MTLIAMPSPYPLHPHTTPLYKTLVIDIHPISQTSIYSPLMEGDGRSGSIKDLPEFTPDVVVDDSTSTASTGRFYECIFCKRGFSTAQALGGHMNIHRKDRAKMKHNPSSSPYSSKLGEDESEGGYGYYSSHHRSVYPPVSESLKNYSAFLPAAAYGERDARKEPRELSLFGERSRLGLGEDGDGRGVGRSGELGEEEEVDLELRLGHEP